MTTKQQHYGRQIACAIILAILAYMMTSSIEYILHTTISLHRFLMLMTTCIVWAMTAIACYYLIRASNIDITYTKRKIIPLVLAVFPIYVFVFQGALLWMWLF